MGCSGGSTTDVASRGGLAGWGQAVHKGTVLAIERVRNCGSPRLALCGQGRQAQGAQDIVTSEGRNDVRLTVAVRNATALNSNCTR
jgi:hypothetical protein